MEPILESKNESVKTGAGATAAGPVNFVASPSRDSRDPRPDFNPATPRETVDRVFKRVEHNFRKNKEQDQTEAMGAATARFSFADCKDEYWNPEKFSLLYESPIWNGATSRQKIILNQLYWVAYYSQIISAEIATIFFNQTSAAALYALGDFRTVCDTLDLESSQERAHIDAFQKISLQTELALFGKRILSYPMRGPYAETMIFGDTNAFRTWWKKLSLNAFTLISSNSPFIGCQYFTVRGLRTLNGKIVQHQLSQFYQKHPTPEQTPVPSQVSYYHFQDESFHFNSSRLLSHEVLKLIRKPTAFEKKVLDVGLWGCQRDHYHFSTAINGIFWYDPAIFPKVFDILTSQQFGLTTSDALELMRQTFCEENEAMHHSHETHRKARESYKSYLADLHHVSKRNQELKLMNQNSLARHIGVNRREFAQFKSGLAKA